MSLTNFYSLYLEKGKYLNGDNGGRKVEIYNPFQKTNSNLNRLWGEILGVFPKDDYSLPLSEDDKKEIETLSKNLMKSHPESEFGD